MNKLVAFWSLHSSRERHNLRHRLMQKHNFRLLQIMRQGKMMKKHMGMDHLDKEFLSEEIKY